MRDAAKVLDLFTQRRKFYDPLHQGMREIQAIYANDVTFPMPTREGKEEESSVPNLLAQGVDQMAGRVASVTPQVIFSADRPGFKESERRATTARRTLTGWWQADRLMLKMNVRARRLLAYAMSPVKINYNFKLGRPTWQIRSPMETFPSPQMFDDTFTPVDTIFAFRRSVKWLEDNGFRDQVSYITNRAELHADTNMLLLEYVDQFGSCLVLTGTANESPNLGPSVYVPPTVFTSPAGQRAVVLADYYHLGECPTAVVPTRIALDGPAGQFDNMVGMFYTQARLMALEIAAIEKGIFPDTVIESRPHEQGHFVDGPYDGRTGKVGIVAGGVLKSMNEQPGYMTPQTIDRLERNSRITAGIPADFGGESQTNVRTGRRGDSLLSAVVDFPLAEAQSVFAASLADENRAAIALAKMYDGSAPKSIFVGTGNDARKVTYVATEVFTHDEHVVSYPATGTDLNSMMLGGGQRVGLGVMSKRSLAEMDPMIASPELEHDRILGEGMEEALMSSLQQRAAAGEIPPLVLAKVMTLVVSDKMELAEALNKVAEDAAAEQEAAAAQQGPPTADQMMAPGAQAALAGPQSAIPGVGSGIEDLGKMMGDLRKPNMTIEPMRGMARGAQ